MGGESLNNVLTWSKELKITPIYSDITKNEITKKLNEEIKEALNTSEYLQKVHQQINPDLENEPCQDTIENILHATDLFSKKLLYEFNEHVDDFFKSHNFTLLKVENGVDPVDIRAILHDYFNGLNQFSDPRKTKEFNDAIQIKILSYALRSNDNLLFASTDKGFNSAIEAEFKNNAKTFISAESLSKHILDLASKLPPTPSERRVIEALEEFYDKNNNWPNDAPTIQSLYNEINEVHLTSAEIGDILSRLEHKRLIKKNKTKITTL